MNATRRMSFHWPLRNGQRIVRALVPASRTESAQTEPLLQFWAPASSIWPFSRCRAFAVPTTSMPRLGLLTLSRETYMDAFEFMVQQLIDTDRQGAREALTMSCEHFPEIYAIGENSSYRAWAAKFRWSDTFDALVNRFDFDEPGAVFHKPQPSLSELIELLP